MRGARSNLRYVAICDRSALAYFRLHGRDAEGYIKGRSCAERFDYDYSPEEVKEIAEGFCKVGKEVERLHGIANDNCSNLL